MANWWSYIRFSKPIVNIYTYCFQKIQKKLADEEGWKRTGRTDYRTCKFTCSSTFTVSPERHLLSSNSNFSSFPFSRATFSFSFSYRRFHSSAVNSSFTHTTFFMVFALQQNHSIKTYNRQVYFQISYFINSSSSYKTNAAFWWNWTLYCTLWWF